LSRYAFENKNLENRKRKLAHRIDKKRRALHLLKQEDLMRWPIIPVVIEHELKHLESEKKWLDLFAYKAKQNLKGHRIMFS
jgi:hypothetical protein